MQDKTVEELREQARALQEHADALEMLRACRDYIALVEKTLAPLVAVNGPWRGTLLHDLDHLLKDKGA